ncbi:MAG TPA: hypothetical protein VKQ32_11185 [Polyangia bacterium]|nr:hypothetical protein [Polyangia bacterium]
MRASLAAIALSLCLLAAPARASLVLALDLPTLVKRADHVAVVDVVSVKADWDAGHEQILSTIDLVVVDSWKGGAAPGSHLTVVQLGGTVGDLTQTVHGMTRFVPGERAVVFLTGRAEHASVVGMAQGKRQIQRDAATGRLFVRAPDRAGATFIRTTPASATAPVFEVRARPLDELKADVRSLAVTANPTSAPGAKPGSPTGGAR